MRESALPSPPLQAWSKHGASAEQTQTRQRKEYHRADSHRQRHARTRNTRRSDRARPPLLCDHNALLDLEELEEKDLTRFRRQYENLAKEARTAPREGGSDTNSPFVANREVGDEKWRDAENDDAAHNEPAKLEWKD
jgi:hypothetical protein